MGPRPALDGGFLRGVCGLKKLCDGLAMTLGEFFAVQAFDELEQEIR